MTLLFSASTGLGPELFVFSTGGWREIGVPAPSLVAEVFSRGTWCVFTTCRMARSSTPGISTARGQSLPPSWAAKAVSASACGKLRSGPRCGSRPLHSFYGPSAKKAHSVRSRSCVSVPVFRQMRAIVLEFQHSTIAICRCCHWMVWNASAEILGELHFICLRFYNVVCVPVLLRLWRRNSWTDSDMHESSRALWSSVSAHSQGTMWRPLRVLRVEDRRLVQGRKWVQTSWRHYEVSVTFSIRAEKAVSRCVKAEGGVRQNNRIR